MGDREDFLPHGKYETYIFAERKIVLDRLQQLENGNPFTTLGKRNPFAVLRVLVDLLAPFSEEALVNFDEAFGESDSESLFSNNEDFGLVPTDHEKSRYSFPWYAAFTDAYEIFRITLEAWENEGGISKQHRAELNQYSEIDEEGAARQLDADGEELRITYASLQERSLRGHLQESMQEKLRLLAWEVQAFWGMSFSSENREEYMETFGAFLQRLAKRS